MNRIGKEVKFYQSLWPFMLNLYILRQISVNLSHKKKCKCCTKNELEINALQRKQGL